MLEFTTFGEGGLRLSVPSNRSLETTDRFDVDVSGTEANIAGILSQLGWKCGWVSSLPDNALGRRVSRFYKGVGIDLSSVKVPKDGKIGVYFVDYASPPRSTKVLFDRKNTCLAQMTKNDVNWDYVLNSQHIHMSGLTAALSESCLEIVKTAISIAHQKGINTSFDINFRSLLWSAEAAKEALLPIIQNVGLCFCSKRDAETVFGCAGEPIEIIKKLSELTSAKIIVLTLGNEGVLGWDGKQTIHEKANRVTIVDRIGAGDAMLAGVLHGLKTSDLKLGLKFGSALAAISLTHFGEIFSISHSELQEIVNEQNQDIQR